MEAKISMLLDVLIILFHPCAPHVYDFQPARIVSSAFGVNTFTSRSAALSEDDEDIPPSKAIDPVAILSAVRRFEILVISVCQEERKR